MRVWGVALILWCTGAALSPSAFAHEVRPAYLGISELEVAGTYEVTWRRPLAVAINRSISPRFPTHCKETTHEAAERSAANLTEIWTISCAGESLNGEAVAIDGLSTTLIDVFVETRSLDGKTSTEIVKASAPQITLAFVGGHAAASYLTLGVEHLLLGFDHILFVIALVLLIRTPLTLLKVITSFTVAHSLTLALSTFGLVRLDQATVEAAIALSIVFLAVEVIKTLRDQGGTRQTWLLRYPWLITFVFGLLHGFGFAGALAAIGLPKGQAAIALLFFNLGVEIGQIAIVLLTLVAIAILHRATTLWISKEGTGQTAEVTITTLLTYGIGSMASYWLIERTLGLF